MYCYVLKLLFLTPQSYSPNLAKRPSIKKSLPKLTSQDYDPCLVVYVPELIRAI